MKTIKGRSGGGGRKNRKGGRIGREEEGKGRKKRKGRRRGWHGSGKAERKAVAKRMRWDRIGLRGVAPASTGKCHCRVGGWWSWHEK